MKPEIKYNNIPSECNYLYAIDKSFLFYKNKLSKKDKKLTNAKLIWKRKKGKDKFAIEFAEWAIDYSFNGMYSNDLKELLEEFKKEKGL